MSFGSGDTGGATGQAGHGGMGSAEADAGWGTNSGGWGAGSAAGAFGGGGGDNGGAGYGKSIGKSAPSKGDKNGSGANTGKNSKNSSPSVADKNGRFDIEGRRGVDNTGKQTGKVGPAERGFVGKAVTAGLTFAGGLLGGVPGAAVAKGLTDATFGAMNSADKNGYGPEGYGVADFGEDFGKSFASSFGRGVVGAVAPGGQVGGMLAGFAFDQAKGLLSDEPGNSSPGTTTGDGFDGFGSGSIEGNTDVASASPGNSSSTPQGVATGWDSNFGNYGSHNSGFNSYGPDTAFDAFS